MGMHRLSHRHGDVRDTVVDLLIYGASGLLFAVDIKCFTAPNQIAPGGVTGLSTVINFLSGAPIGLLNFLLNLPMFIWAFFEVGYKLVLRTVAANLITSLCIDQIGSRLPAYAGNPMLAALFGGLLEGISLSLVFMREATTGGTDLVARLLKRRFRHLSTGRLMLSIDLIIVLISAVVYKRIESILYALIYIFISTRVIDTILYGADIGHGKVMWIMTAHSEQVAQKIMDELDRGVTGLQARGMYSGIHSEMLMCAVSRTEVYRVKDLVHSVDPDAFIIVGDAGEISGEGFNHPTANDKTLPELVRAARRKKEAH